MAFTKVSEIVGMFLDEINGGKSEYSRAYRIAARGWRELNWDVTGKLKRTKLSVDCDLTANLPDDFIREVRVGIINSQGEIASLTENNNLTTFCPSDEGFSEDWYLYDDNWRILGNPISQRGSLGIGSNNNIGEFRIDRDEHIIILDPCFSYDCVALEYLSSGNTDGDLKINEQCSEALISYIRWKWHIAKKNVTQGDKATYRKEYFNELRLAKSRVRAPMLQTMNQMSRQSVKSAIKS